MKDELDALKNINWAAEFDMDEPTDTNVDAGTSLQMIKNSRTCPGHEVCFSIEKTVEILDIPEENISTLLCYLELHEEKFIQMLSRAYTMCKVMSYSGANSLRAAAKSCPPLAMAIALDLKRNISHDQSTFIEFGVVDVAAAIGWDSGVVKYQLKNLEWTTENGLPKRSTISVSFFDLGFRVRAPGDLTDTELDDTLDMLYERVTKQERAQLLQLQCVSDALQSVAFTTYVPCSTASIPTGPSDKLKAIIRDYFQNDYPTQIELKDDDDATADDYILNDIRTLIHQYPENNFTGRALARIFHGVQSPNYPAVIWGRCKYWRVHIKTNFNRIVVLANTEIVRMRTQVTR
jgi:ATP-dependent DNA helicase Q4